MSEIKFKTIILFDCPQFDAECRNAYFFRWLTCTLETPTWTLSCRNIATATSMNPTKAAGPAAPSSQFAPTCLSVCLSQSAPLSPLTSPYKP